MCTESYSNICNFNGWKNQVQEAGESKGKYQMVTSCMESISTFKEVVKTTINLTKNVGNYPLSGLLKMEMW